MVSPSVPTAMCLWLLGVPLPIFLRTTTWIW